MMDRRQTIGGTTPGRKNINRRNSDPVSNSMLAVLRTRTKGARDYSPVVQVERRLNSLDDRTEKASELSERTVESTSRSNAATNYMRTKVIADEALAQLEPEYLLHLKMQHIMGKQVKEILRSRMHAMFAKKADGAPIGGELIPPPGKKLL